MRVKICVEREGKKSKHFDMMKMNKKLRVWILEPQTTASTSAENHKNLRKLYFPSDPSKEKKMSTS